MLLTNAALLVPLGVSLVNILDTLLEAAVRVAIRVFLFAARAAAEGFLISTLVFVGDVAPPLPDLVLAPLVVALLLVEMFALGEVESCDLVRREVAGNVLETTVFASR